MQNPYIALLGISYIALLFILGAVLLGIPLFGSHAPCDSHSIPCGQLAVVSH